MVVNSVKSHGMALFVLVLQSSKCKHQVIPPFNLVQPFERDQMNVVKAFYRVYITSKRLDDWKFTNMPPRRYKFECSRHTNFE